MNAAIGQERAYDVVGHINAAVRFLAQQLVQVGAIVSTGKLLLSGWKAPVRVIRGAPDHPVVAANVGDVQGQACGVGSAAIGDHTRRPVRGFAAAFFYTALGVVAANVSMIRRFLGRVQRDEKTPPKVRDPHPPRDPALATAHPNAPPAQHVA